MKLCLFGGSFNPVHNGHVYYTEKILTDFQPDLLILMPAFQAPLKDEKPLDSTHRLNMINMVLNNMDKVIISDWEIKQKGTSYTINTVKYILSEYENIQEFFILTGMDQAVDLHKWKSIKEMLDLGIRFLIFPREGYSENQIRPEIREACLFVSGPLITISSSHIRQMVREGKDVKQLLPDTVGTYIKKHGLYQNA